METYRIESHGQPVETFEAPDYGHAVAYVEDHWRRNRQSLGLYFEDQEKPVLVIGQTGFIEDRTGIFQAYRVIDL